MLVRTLAQRHLKLGAECGDLRDRAAASEAALSVREARIAELETELQVSSQLRVDVGKRIDDLLGQLDQLDQALAPPEPAE